MVFSDSHCKKARAAIAGAAYPCRQAARKQQITMRNLLARFPDVCHSVALNDASGSSG